MRKSNVAVCLLLIALACAAALYYWPQLPLRVPTHWNIDGQPDAWGAPIALLLLGPGAMTLALLMGFVLPWLSPRGFDVKRFEPAFNYIVTLIVGLFGYIYAIQLAASLNAALSFGSMLMGGVCLLLVLLGNQMGKVRRNFYIGIRTPWTLASERVWEATHRLSAKLMVASGLLGLVAIWAGAGHGVVVALSMGWAVVAVPYSLLYYKRLEKTHQLESN